MNYEIFEELLKEANLTKKEFAELVDMNYTSVTNWNKSEKIPSWVKSWLENYKKAKVSDKVIDAVKPFVKV
ncbi:helix-turn-helix domain-containing protein [Aliarcobacter cryaerophilus]|uniref:helix-turn-helix domain-containing protein n=1 Tax=Aliarcobacter cryaerophilus TaxID=28198 RepID=UPI003DA4F88E